MVRLMYATAVPNWDEGTIKDVCLATFTQEHKNLLERSVTVQVTQLTNLFKTIFSTEPENEEDDAIRSRKQDDTDGTSNIVLPCPGS